MSIGVIGTGLMGEPIARRLLESGHDIAVYNRTESKTRRLLEAGAQASSTVAELIAGAEICITMLSDASALRGVLLEGDALASLNGRTLVQMSTIGPGESRDLATRLAEAGVAYLEAPVLGSVPQAEAGELIIMTAGPTETLESVRPVLECIGKRIEHAGDIGAAATLKLALNQLIAGLTASFALSLGLVRRSGCDVDQFMRILRDSALYAPTFDKKLSMMLSGQYTPVNFPLQHLVKDMHLMLREADRLGLTTSALESVLSLLEAAPAEQAANIDYSAIYEAVDKGST